MQGEPDTKGEQNTSEKRNSEERRHIGRMMEEMIRKYLIDYGRISEKTGQRPQVFENGAENDGTEDES